MLPGIGFSLWPRLDAAASQRHALLMSESIWEDPKSVAKFAGREPDLRLLELIEDREDPAAVRVLDLGCAGGRNSELLARRGFDIYALDWSQAMVAHTRKRLTPIFGERQAARRVRRGRMHDLGEFADASFDLIVAIGIYHCASSRAEWDSALAHSARLLTSGGQLLVAVFTPETDLTGEGIRPVPGQPHLYDGLPSGRVFLVDQETLDAEMRGFGLEPAVASRTVRAETTAGHRVTVNALYLKKRRR